MTAKISGNKLYLFVPKSRGLSVYDADVANNLPPLPGDGLPANRPAPVAGLNIAAPGGTDTNTLTKSLSLTPDGKKLVMNWEFGDYGLVVIDVTNPTAPLQLSQNLSGGLVTGVFNKVFAFTRGGKDYAAALSGTKLSIIDITDGRNPVLVTTLTVRGSELAQSKDGRGDFLWLAGAEGLKVWNIAFVGSPIPLDLAATGINPVGISYVALDDTRLYVSRGTGEVEVWDASNFPASLSLLGSYLRHSTWKAQRLNPDFPLLYVSASTKGFDVLDLSDLPTITSLQPSSYTPELQMQDRYIVPDPRGGMFYRAAMKILSSYKLECLDGPNPAITNKTVADANGQAPGCGGPTDLPTNCDGLLDPGEDIQLSITVQNGGQAASAPYVGTLTRSSPPNNGITITDAAGNFGQLGQGASATQSFAFTVAANATGTAGFELDLNNGIPAERKLLTFSYPIQPASPQLVLGTLTRINNLAGTAEIEIRNLGTAAASAFTGELSTNTSGVSVDAPGTQAYGSLAPSGGTQTRSFPLTIGSFTGSFVTFTLKRDGALFKTFNLAADGSGFVTSAPALVFESKAVRTATPGNLEIDATLRNWGAQLPAGALATLSASGGTDYTMGNTSSAYGTIANSGTGKNATPFTMTLGPNAGGIVDMTLVVTGSGGSWTMSFEVDLDARPEFTYNSNTWTELPFGGDGVIAKGEAGSLGVKLNNIGLGDSTNALVTLSSNADTHIDYTNTTANYSIAAGGNQSKGFAFLLNDTFTGSSISFTVSCNDPQFTHTFTRTVVSGCTSCCNPGDCPPSDTVKPNVTMTAPLGGTLTGSVTISGTATDNVAVSSVVLLVDGTQKLSLTRGSGSSYSGTFNAASVPAGAHTMALKATDSSGNNRTTANVNVTTTGGGTSNCPSSYRMFPDFSAPNCSGTACTATSGVAVPFTDTSQVANGLTPVGTATAWDWDFNNDGTVDSTAQNPSYAFPAGGTYTVKLTAKYTTPPCNLAAAAIKTFTVTSAGPPQLQFVSVTWRETPLAGNGKLNRGETGNMQVRLRNSGTGAATGVAVTLTDSAGMSYLSQATTVTIAPGAEAVASFLFTVPADLAASSSNFTITAVAPAFTHTFAQDIFAPGEGTCVATLTPSFAVGSCVDASCDAVANVAVQLNDRSTVSDGATTPAPSWWAWDIDNDGDTDSPLRNYTLTFPTPGTYTVRLTVGYNSSICALTRTTTRTLVVLDHPVPLGEQLYVPASAHTPGAANTTWRSSLTLFNPAETESDVKVAYLPSGGASNPEPLTHTITLAPRETREIDDVLVEIFGVDPAAQEFGGLQLETTNTDRVVPIVNSRTYNDLGIAGTYGQFIASRSFLANQVTGASRTQLYGLASANGYRTNLGLLNTTAAATAGEISFFNQEGARISGPHSISLAPFAHVQLSQTYMSGAYGVGNIDLFRAQVEVTDGGNLFAYASIVDPSSDPMYVDSSAVDSASQRVVVLGAANVPGRNGTRWRSDAYFYNPADEDVHLEIRFVELGQTPGTLAPLTLDLGPGESRRIADIVGGSFGVEKSGALVVTALSFTGTVRPLVSCRTYNSVATGTFGQYIPAISASDAAIAGIAAQDDLFIVGLQRNARFRSNLVLFNPGTTTARFTVNLLGANGALLAARTHTLAPQTYDQVPVFEWMGLPAGDHTQVSAAIHADAGSVLALGSVIDQTTGDPSRIPGIHP